MDKPKCWVKNVITKITDERKSWVQILNYIFNPTFGFVHIWPNVACVMKNCVNKIIYQAVMQTNYEKTKTRENQQNINYVVVVMYGILKKELPFLTSV